MVVSNLFQQMLAISLLILLFFLNFDECKRVSKQFEDAERPNEVPGLICPVLLVLVQVLRRHDWKSKRDLPTKHIITVASITENLQSHLH